MIVDISPPLTPRTAVFPGDTPLSRTVLLDTARGDHITLSTLTSTVHIGAHADAQSHYAPGGRSIEAHPLEPYIGPCVVADVHAHAGRRFGLGAIDAAALEAFDGLVAQGHSGRLLLRTGSAPRWDAFAHDLAAPEPALIEALADRGLALLGVDTPSVDLAEAKELVTHAACARAGVFILEGLVLEGVQAGVWELVALPLPLVGFDASPVRAILRRRAQDRPG
ncbi:MAG: kynurenine formamidase [Phycisphaerales bacterium]|nr:MAG: kynurenine formamidase [Phycisphaerales bacterium]